MTSDDAHSAARKFVETLAGRLGVDVLEQPEADRIVIHKGNRVTFEITVPHSVLEWFALARDAGDEIWSDWADYYSVDGESIQELRREMFQDIQTFAQAVYDSPCRVSWSLSGKKVAEWNRAGQWRPVQICTVT